MRNLDAPLRDGKPIRVERAAPVSLQAYATLRHAFVTLRLRVGQSLSEQGIAQQLRTSRTPVCEAFIKLADAGLSEVLPQRGTFVRKISLKAVRDARFVREAPNWIPRPFGHKVGSFDAAVSLSVEGP